MTINEQINYGEANAVQEKLEAVRRTATATPAAEQVYLAELKKSLQSAAACTGENAALTEAAAAFAKQSFKLSLAELRAKLDLTMIAAIAADYAIGCQGDLLIRLSSDLRRFKELTWGQRIIYGRKTLQTFPKAQALPGRENIILSSNFAAANVKVCSSITELFEYLLSLSAQDASADAHVAKKNIVIGGASLYHSLYPFSNNLDITFIDHVFPKADSYFPCFDKDFLMVATSDKQLDADGNIAYYYRQYCRKTC